MTEPHPVTIPAFVVGHAVRTTNAAESDQSSALLPGLWTRVIGDKDLLSYAGRVDDRLYAVLFDYESDETGAYTQVVGIGVDAPDSIPHDYVTVRVSDQARRPYVAEGAMPAALISAWRRIWSESASEQLRRAFSSDVEVHLADGRATILVATTP